MYSEIIFRTLFKECFNIFENSFQALKNRYRTKDNQKNFSVPMSTNFFMSKICKNIIKVFFFSEYNHLNVERKCVLIIFNSKTLMYNHWKYTIKSQWFFLRFITSEQFLNVFRFQIERRIVFKVFRPNSLDASVR